MDNIDANTMHFFVNNNGILQNSTPTSNSAPTSASPATVTPEVNGVASNTPNQGNGGNIPTDGHNQSSISDGEGRGKKKSLLHGKGKGIGALPKGRGPSTAGWTGAGFDVDTRS